MKKLFLMIVVLMSSFTPLALARENTEWTTAFWYNANDNTRPRVLLVGDSICNGYQPLVLNELAGVVNVAFCATSKCVTDSTYLDQLSFMLNESHCDVIHFNNGLHSLEADPAKWEAGLRSAIALIKQKCPDAKIIWASSTPLNDPQRTLKVQALNAIASRVMQENHISIDDLYASMDQLDRKQYWVDVYHFNKQAKVIQAKQVASYVLAALGKKPASEKDSTKALLATESETGPEGRLTTGQMVADAIKNPGFESTGGWSIYPNDPAQGNFSFKTNNPHSGRNSAEIHAFAPGVQFYQPSPQFEANASYRITFWAKADKTDQLQFNIRTRKPPYVFYGDQTYALQSEWKQYTVTIKLPQDYDHSAHVMFFILKTAGTVWIDDISVEKQ
jgi:hypothetical protein